MKRNLLVMLIVVICFRAQAQKQPAVAPPKDRSGAMRIDSTTSIRDRLVQLAMQNPSIEVDDRNIIIANYGLKRAKANILNQVVIQGNLNEYSINGATQIYGITYPRYNIGASVPLGLFSIRSLDTRTARQGIGIARALKEDHYRVLRQEVLTKYEDYLMDKQLLNFQKQLYEDVHSTFIKAEQDYAGARIKVEEYNNAYRSDNLENTKLISLQRNLNVVILELERYIGVKLEDVLNNYK